MKRISLYSAPIHSWRYGFANIKVSSLSQRSQTGRSIIVKVIAHDAPECQRVNDRKIWECNVLQSSENDSCCTKGKIASYALSIGREGFSPQRACDYFPIQSRGNVITISFFCYQFFIDQTLQYFRNSVNPTNMIHSSLSHGRRVSVR